MSRARPHHPRCRGLGAVAVIVVLVAMAGMAATVLRMGAQAATVQQQDVAAQRATAAARSGLEWGLYRALVDNWASCFNTSQTLNFMSESGVLVTVRCNSVLYYESETSSGVPTMVRVYTLEATACNGSGSCPDATAAVRQGYVEARLVAQATSQ